MMRFFWNNLIDASGVGITATSQQTALPATNVAHSHLARTWRTTGSNTNEYVIFDFGSATAATSFLVAGHDITSGDSNIKLNASVNNFIYSTIGDDPMTHSTGTMKNVFNSASYRYWQFYFTKSASSQIRNVGRLFLGTYTDINEDLDYGDFEEKPVDMSVDFRSIGGQCWSDIRNQYRVFTGRISDASQASADSLKTIASAVGTHTPFFVQFNTSDSSSLPTGEILYVKFKSLTGRKVSSYDSEYKWDLKFDLEEVL